MHSSLLPWDFFHKHPQVIEPKKPGLYAFLVTDPYFERVLFERLPKKELSLSLYSGVDITREFIEEHLVNLSFFSSTDHIQVMNAENISAPHLQFLIEAPIDWSERFMILFFTKSNKAFTELTKNKNCTSFDINEPRFWEGAKLWQFCQKVKGVQFGADISAFILEHLEHNFESFFWVIESIKLNFSLDKLTLADVQSLVKKERWDFFSLADTFGQSPKNFFLEVLKKEDRDNEWFRSLFAFMQGHLSKALFPEEIRAKSKLSKYDETLVLLAEKWPRAKVFYYLKFFSELEILAKLGDELLIDKLRLEVV